MTNSSAKFLSPEMLRGLQFLGRDREWLGPFVPAPPDIALAKLGLIEMRPRKLSRDGAEYYDYQITDAGVQLLADLDALVDVILAGRKPK